MKNRQPISKSRSDTTQPNRRKIRNKEYLEYKRYIHSATWKEIIRPKVLERDEYRCQCCGRTIEDGELNVHHSTYSVLYRELEGDNLKYLITLCPVCHSAIHSTPLNFHRFNKKGH